MLSTRGLNNMGELNSTHKQHGNQNTETKTARDTRKPFSGNRRNGDLPLQISNELREARSWLSDGMIGGSVRRTRRE